MTHKTYRVIITFLDEEGADDTTKPKRVIGLTEMPSGKGTGSALSTARMVWIQEGSPARVVVAVEEVKILAEWEVKAGDWMTLGRDQTRREAGSVTAKSNRKPR